MLRNILYWLTTLLVVLAYASGGYYDLSQPDMVRDAATHLGYPLYFFTVLGIWKFGAVIALLAPGLPRLKEWAYAGIAFNLTGAAATHAFVHDPPQDVATPLILLAIAVVSWATRPAGRKLSGPIV
jgi:hypothetical protein